MIFLNKKNVLVLGGDARTMEVISKLTEKGIQVFAAGFEKIKFDSPHVQHTTIDSLDPSYLDAILLPVQGTDTSGNVEANYSDKKIVLRSEERRVGKECRCWWRREL